MDTWDITQVETEEILEISKPTLKKGIVLSYIHIYSKYF